MNAQRNDDDTLLMPLGHYRLLRAHGEDSGDFLQGQLGNDVRRVDAAHHQLSSYSSPKGRILALFRLFRRGDDYLLRMPADTLEPCLKRLSMFVLMSKVQLSEAEEMQGLGLAGPQASALLQEHCGGCPAEPGESSQQGDISILRVPGEQPRFELYGPREAIQGLSERLAGQTTAADSSAWSLLEIRAGLPTLYAANSEAFVAQMLNMQLIDGVSFKKGCYPGQEVVARMQYLGKLKRRMFRAQVATEVCPQPGDELFSPQSSSSQGAGRVVDAAPGGQGCELLLVAETTVASEGDLHLNSLEGVKLELLQLPYAFEQEA